MICFDWQIYNFSSLHLILLLSFYIQISRIVNIAAKWAWIGCRSIDVPFGNEISLTTAFSLSLNKNHEQNNTNYINWKIAENKKPKKRFERNIKIGQNKKKKKNFFTWTSKCDFNHFVYRFVGWCVHAIDEFLSSSRKFQLFWPNAKIHFWSNSSVVKSQGIQAYVFVTLLSHQSKINFLVSPQWLVAFFFCSFFGSKIFFLLFIFFCHRFYVSSSFLYILLHFILNFPVGNTIRLVNNVGQMYDYPDELGNVSAELLSSIINTNVGAVTMMTRMLVNDMKSRGKGAIVNISSGSELQPLPYMAVYSASKVRVRGNSLYIDPLFIYNYFRWFGCGPL